MTEEVASTVVGSDETSKYVCNVCDKSFATKCNLKRHMHSHNSDPSTTIKCAHCSVLFKSKLDCENHKRANHESNICEQCGKSYVRRSDLNLHRRKHNGTEDTKVFVCPFESCRKKFYRQTKYNDHFNTHTGNQPYSCDKCSRKFASRYVRNAHYAVCSNQKDIKCDKCGAQFQYPASLYNHKMAVHSDQSFVCGCGSTYKYRAGLLKHKAAKKH